MHNSCLICGQGSSQNEFKLKWRLEYRTCLDFEWSKVVQMLNGSDFKWHSKTKHPDHSKSDQIAAFLDSYVLFPFLNGTIALAIVPTIIILNHTQSENQNIQILNGF